MNATGHSMDCACGKMVRFVLNGHEIGIPQKLWAQFEAQAVSEGVHVGEIVIESLSADIGWLPFDSVCVHQKTLISYRTHQPVD